jgi:hypothetical protein
MPVTKKSVNLCVHEVSPFLNGPGMARNSGVFGICGGIPADLLSME